MRDPHEANLVVRRVFFFVVNNLLACGLVACGGTGGEGAGGAGGAGGTPCVAVDDENPCTEDVCERGVPGHKPVPAGASCADDGNPCTAGACDSAGSCVHSALSDGTGCGAGQVCAMGGCSAGCFISGVLYAPEAPNPANVCEVCSPGKATEAWSGQTDGLTCDDGDGCTEAETCQAGACTSGNSVACEANASCVAGACACDKPGVGLAGKVGYPAGKHPPPSRRPT